MNSRICARRARKRIASKIRWRLAKYSNFACSICGAIPIVFHHIEKWSLKYSNNEKYLIPICDKCHRSIHGEGGSLFSNKELYQYKDRPMRPSVLRDRLPLDGKQSYSFFIGSNFIGCGTNAPIFKVSGNHDLISIDMSEGLFKLNILAGAKETEEFYLIKENELIIESEDIWDMKYSRNALTIKRRSGSHETVFIDLIIEPEIIILRKMSTTFNGIPFRIYKLKKPHPARIQKLESIVKLLEDKYIEISKEIDLSPNTGRVIQGMDLDVALKQVNKSMLKSRMERMLYFEIPKEFTNWEMSNYLWALEKVLDKSKVFHKRQNNQSYVMDEIKKMNDYVTEIKKKYRRYFKDLEDIIVEFGGISMLGNIQVPTL